MWNHRSPYYKRAVLWKCTVYLASQEACRRWFSKALWVAEESGKVKEVDWEADAAGILKLVFL